MISEKAKSRWITAFNNGVSLSFAPKSVQDDKDLVLYAVARNGLNLEFASERLKRDIDVVEMAVSQTILAFQFANVDLQKQIVFCGIDEFKKNKSDASDIVNGGFDDNMTPEAQELYDALIRDLLEGSHCGESRGFDDNMTPEAQELYDALIRDLLEGSHCGKSKG